VSLVNLLGERPDGSGAPVDWPFAVRWLGERYLGPMTEESKQVERAQRRAALYRDAGQQYVRELIDKVFDDRDTKERRDRWVDQAGYNNVTRRIVHELATLYRRPATRSVEGVDNAVKYQAAQRLVRLDETMLDAQRLTILQRATLLGPRVPAWSGIPRVDIVERHQFRLVRHPLEPTRLIAVILDQGGAVPNTMPGAEVPRWVVWTDAEWFWIGSQGSMLGKPQENRYGRIPFVLAALNPPPGELIDSTTFEDVIAAHIAVWFEGVLLLKESKSATKVPVLSGDTARAVRGQSLDSESAIELPEGVALTQSDTGMDLQIFRDTADHILERAAANHGIPPAILHHAGATSGYEIELRHVGIRERRIEQEGTFREVERELADLLAIVIEKDAPALKFSTEGWSLNYGEIQMPRSPKEELEIFEHSRTLGLTDTIEELMRRDPDKGPAEAEAEMQLHIARETERVMAMRELQALSGAMGSEQPDGNDEADEKPAREAMQ
jgi:hypothetical protein